jgi:hypothetical protein
VHFLREETDQQAEWLISKEALAEFKKAIEVEGDFKKVAVDPTVPDRAVCLNTETSLEEQVQHLTFLNKNNDAFAWSTFDLMGVSREIIEHKLQVNSSVKPKKQKLPQNVRGKNRCGEGRSVATAGCRFHQGDSIPQMISKCGDGPKKEWKVANVYKLH